VKITDTADAMVLIRAGLLDDEDVFFRDYFAGIQD
jgi:hypothetical protein